MVSRCALPCRACYSTDMQPGGKIFRLHWMAWRGDFGLTKFIEPEEFITLAELILVEG